MRRFGHWSTGQWQAADFCRMIRSCAERAASAELLQSTLHWAGRAAALAPWRVSLFRVAAAPPLSPRPAPPRPAPPTQQSRQGKAGQQAAPDWSLPSRRWWPVWERGGLCTAGLTLAGPPTRHSAAKSAGRVWPAQQDSRTRFRSPMQIRQNGAKQF